MPEPDSPLYTIEPLLVAEIRQFRRSWTVGAQTLAAVLLAAVVIGAVALPRPDALQVAGLAAVLGIPSIALLWISGARSPERHRALRALRTRASSVVWVYTRLYHGSQRLDELRFNFEDGAVEALPVDPSRSRALLARVATLLPRATIGFSPEAADAFLRAPRELYRATPQQIRIDDEVPATAWLLPFAAATYRARRWAGALGVLMIALGVLAIGIIAAAASPRDQPALLIAVFTGAALLPGALLVMFGFARFEHGELATALRAPAGRIRRVEISHQANVEGDYVDVAAVTLESGRLYVFWVDKTKKDARV